MNGEPGEQRKKVPSEFVEREPHEPARHEKARDHARARETLSHESKPDEPAPTYPQSFRGGWVYLIYGAIMVILLIIVVAWYLSVLREAGVRE